MGGGDHVTVRGSGSAPAQWDTEPLALELGRFVDQGRVIGEGDDGTTARLRSQACSTVSPALDRDRLVGDAAGRARGVPGVHRPGRIDRLGSDRGGLGVRPGQAQ